MIWIFFSSWISSSDMRGEILASTQEIPACVSSISAAPSDPLIPNVTSFLRRIVMFLNPESPIKLPHIKNIIMRLHEASFRLGLIPGHTIYNIGENGKGEGGSRFCFPYYSVLPNGDSDLVFLFQFLTDRNRQNPNVAFIGAADGAEAHVTLALKVKPNIFLFEPHSPCQMAFGERLWALAQLPGAEQILGRHYWESDTWANSVKELNPHVVFDAIYARNVLHCMNDRELISSLELARQRLAPGGLFLGAVDGIAPDSALKPEMLRKYQEHKLKVLAMERLLISPARFAQVEEEFSGLKSDACTGVDYKSPKGFYSEKQYFEPAVLKRFLQEAGFAQVHIHISASQSTQRFPKIYFFARCEITK